jgi:hypothetical protein
MVLYPVFLLQNIAQEIDVERIVKRSEETK